VDVTRGYIYPKAIEAYREKTAGKNDQSDSVKKYIKYKRQKDLPQKNGGQKICDIFEFF